MPSVNRNFIASRLLTTIAGILAAGVNTMYNIVPAFIGAEIMESDLPTGYTFNSAMVRGAIGSTVYMVASNLLIKDFFKEEKILLPFNYAKKLIPYITPTLPFIAEVVGDAVNSYALNINCLDTDTGTYQQCRHYDSFLSRYAKAGLVGHAVLVSSYIVIYLGYKAFENRRAQAVQVDQPDQVNEAQVNPLRQALVHPAAGYIRIEGNQQVNIQIVMPQEQQVENLDLGNRPEGQPEPFAVRNARQNPVAAPEVKPEPVHALQNRLDATGYKGEIQGEFIDIFHYSLMDEPAMLKCGHNFDRVSLPEMKEKYKGGCPCCHVAFVESDFTHPSLNVFLKSKIIEFVEDQERRLALQKISASQIGQIEGEIEEKKNDVAEAQSENIIQCNMDKLNQLGISLSTVNKKFICPLTNRIMDYPYRASDNVIYEKSAFLKYISDNKNQQPLLSPVTKRPLTFPKNDHFPIATDIQILIERFLAFRAKPGTPANKGLFQVSGISHFGHQNQNRELQEPLLPAMQR